MRRKSTAPVYVSRNQLEGSLADVPLDRLLTACHRHLVTGDIRIEVDGVGGHIELRAGAVDRAEFGDIGGARALGQMRMLVDGSYELCQRLPDLTGVLGGASVCEGDITGVPLIALMQHCEHHALTCTITVVSRFDRATIDYHAGEIRRVELNGFYDDDAIIQVLDWSEARFRIAAPPLDLDIEGWPKVGREPTLPFAIGQRFARGTSPQFPVVATKPPPVPPPPVPPLPPPPVVVRPPEPSVVAEWMPRRAEILEAPAPAPVRPVRVRPRADRRTWLDRAWLSLLVGTLVAAVAAVIAFTW